jgi:nucleotide-binding universal stress UspA family protein
MDMKTLKSKAPSKDQNLASSPAPRGIKSILVPVDFSKASVKALIYAESLCQQFGATMTLLYVIEPIGAADFMYAFPLTLGEDEMRTTAKARLEKFARKNGVKRSLVEKTLVRSGRAFHEISEAARTLKVDLIVISTHGYSGLNHAIMGSVTERVVRHAPCPVLVVRESERDFISP